MTTKDQIKAEIKILMAICQAIRELGQAPSGHIFATMMHFISHESYENMINTLINQKLIRRDGQHMLYWIGE